LLLLGLVSLSLFELLLCIDNIDEALKKAAEASTSTTGSGGDSGGDCDASPVNIEAELEVAKEDIDGGDINR
jgi:hypothetical protein